MHRPPYHMLYTRYRLRTAGTLDVQWVPEPCQEVVGAWDEVTPDLGALGQRHWQG